MAAFYRKVTLFLGKHSSNPSLLNFYGLQQVRYVRRGVGEQLVIYPKEPKKSRRKDVYQHFPSNEERDKNLVEDIFESEVSEELIQLYDSEQNVSRFKEQLKRDSKRNDKRLKMQIINRKYFKPEKEENVLAWRAKEQIQYLHKNYPEEWSITALAGVFPVSVYGVLKIVKSNYIGISQNEIKRHDRKVLEKWEEWSQQGVDDYRMTNIMYAAGIPELPVRSKPKPNRYQKPGPFSDIFNRCVHSDKLLESVETADDEEVASFYQAVLKDLFDQNKDSTPEEKYQKHRQSSVDNSKVTSNQISEGQVYKDGKTVFDEDGEFLFRIP